MKVTKKQALFGLLRFFILSTLQIYSTYLLFKGHFVAGFSFATITFGDTASPSNIAIYFDALFSQSLANWKDRLVDNIGAGNAFLYSLLKSDMYESADGGTYIMEDLMYALSPMESY